ncbi:MAG: hypothetical protein A2451_02445 [Bdellovibrionales bacterium RIFOXYC2_FULL_39_8]|nr:MAG: hypothetical protein A2451_02445 [Bdellovibrionales bacterium RIFOXYC2_FULL_39_8]
MDELSNLALREILFAKIEEGELTKRSQLKYLLEKEADQLAGLSIKKLTAEGGNISSTIQ